MHLPRRTRANDIEVSTIYGSMMSIWFSLSQFSAKCSRNCTTRIMMNHIACAGGHVVQRKNSLFEYQRYRHCYAGALKVYTVLVLKICTLQLNKFILKEFTVSIVCFRYLTDNVCNPLVLRKPRVFTSRCTRTTCDLKR